MFDPAFRLALIISISAHVAVMAPVHFFADREESAPDAVQLNYVIVEDPSLASEEEIYRRSSALLSEKTPAPEESLIESPEMTDHMRIDTYVAERPEKREKDDRDEKAADDEAFLKYYNLIREKIRARLHSAGLNSRKGEVDIIFTIAPDGRLVQAYAASAKGRSSCASKAVRAVMSAAPFPEFSERLGEQPITFSLNVRFTSE